MFGALISAAVGIRRANVAEVRPARLCARRCGLRAAASIAQLGLGALVAGLRAGQIYNTWPLMGPRFLPREAFGSFAAPLFDATTAQFDHRLIAYLVLAFALAQAAAAVRWAPAAVAGRAAGVAAIAALQVALGVTTLVFSVPIALALAHQALALILFGLAAAHWSATRDAASQ